MNDDELMDCLKTHSMDGLQRDPETRDIFMRLRELAQLLKEVESPPEVDFFLVLRNDNGVRAIPLCKTNLEFGRKSGIVDSKLSYHHFTLHLDGGVWTLTDCNSTNGTWVNTKQIETHKLVNGDLIEVGHQTLYFVDDRGVTVPDSED